MNPWIKICGNTRLEDCLYAASCGADAVGFIFAPGKRNVTAEQIAPLVKQLPDTLERIGVFTDPDAESIVRTASQVGLTGTQLHCAYNPALLHSVKDKARVAGRSLHLMQVVTWNITEESFTQTEALRALCKHIQADGLADRLLIDSCTPRTSGGTGIVFDWKAAQAALSGLTVPVIVAGGLRPENVVQAVRAFHPFGVDVSSGVEDKPGEKNAAAVEQFIQNARTA